MAKPVPENINFPKEEENILKLWTELNAFQTSLKQSEGKPRYTFYDGPPFATGLPHYGHILAGTIKDIVTRFAHQSGFHVERRFGWDCHGLPVEYEIDKALGIKGPGDVAKLGIENYNNECRKIVMRYAGDWETIISRMGRWIDFKNDYKTLYPSFMESVWWVFQELFKKGLVYKGFKVMHFSTGLHTTLSNFEAGLNYKEVNDPAVIISFPLVEDPDVSLIAWTTTPWTLPSNLALCVNPEKKYVKVRDVATKKVYIMMEARTEALFKKPADFEIISTFLGAELKNKQYTPLFEYFTKRADLKPFRVCVDKYVTEESGTGVVHQAPYFGEDDFRVCLAHGIMQRDSPLVCPVDATGCFTDEVSDFKGQYVKDADKAINKYLKEHGRLVHASQTKHSYPFCYRSETPLIYKAVPSWFVRVEPMIDRLLENNQQTRWVPDFVKEKRFGNWLKEARDWPISRSRYWGTPIPLWISDDGEGRDVCVGSIEELATLTGTRVTDLHRETVDKLEIPSQKGKGMLKRIPEVFDCWFESAACHYASSHYPFENQKEFEDKFPADFIAEGIDQTRGWFYTLLVLSTALFNKPPSKNVIVNGLVLADDGQKMSKSKKNYPDPMEVVDKYGADALRLYLINSPVVRAENLRFKEAGVRDVLKDVFLPWYNAYRFFAQQKELFEKENSTQFIFSEKTQLPTDNIMDRWILSFTQSLLQFVKDEMQAYRLYTVVPRLIKFVDLLTNWYVRSNRKRLRGSGGIEDCRKALETLFTVLFSMVRMMAPFTPFLAELLYQNLKDINKSDSTEPRADQSVHYLMFPDPRFDLVDVNIERAVARMQTVVELGRQARERRTLPIKFTAMAKAVPENINFPKEEENVLKLWAELDAFKTPSNSRKESLGERAQLNRTHVYLLRWASFATGLPHYGHFLAGTIKDIVTRFAHQSGFHVERRFGWDCHGLPVEYEIDKALGIKGPGDVAKLGIENYNNECRKIVMRYAADWETIISRMGRWIDFKNDYKTLYPSFMESVWWVFQELFKKGLVYKGLNYKEVNDPAVIISFPLVEDPDVSLIAWTTTPWTLPSNLALCVNPEKKYVKVRDMVTKKVYIMMEARTEALFKKTADFEIISTFLGAELKNKQYTPLFEYFTKRADLKPFRVCWTSTSRRRAAPGLSIKPHTSER
ncbi:Isoleucine--tRNA ligase, cytoplasmic [Hypsibius exemplaris]|uniref:Isoleucine--tRNA ligase, cytoplasmic n=1 Tax=Hypsibius exemplaris TaxID=2072580 RepID=A0A1W0XAN3_HYPEX|nr:Isoleucine--tRNA ligase, cytoplasmic [Hypsibius exemplaris]